MKEAQPILVSVDFQTQFADAGFDQTGIAPLDSSVPQFPKPILNDALLTILGDLGSTEIFDYDAETTDEEAEDRYAGQFDITYEAGGSFISQLQFGGKFQRANRNQLRIDIADSEDSVGDVAGLDLGPDGSLIPGNPDPAFLLSDTNLLNSTPFDLGPIGDIYAPFGLETIPDFNREALLTFARNAIRDSQGIEEINFVDARETIYASYAQGLFEFGDLSIIAGVRVEHYRGNFEAPQTGSFDVEFEAASDSGNIEIPGTEDDPATITTTANNTEVLPRIQANYRPTDDLIFRAAAYTSIARPAFDALAGEADLDVFVDFETGDLATATIDDVREVIIDVVTGNPDLENAYAWNFDLGAEYYFSRGSALTLGLFYKRIENFIFVDQNADFSAADAGDLDLAGFIDSIALTDDGAALLERLGGGAALAGFDNLDLTVEAPRNGRTAEVYGVEFGIYHLFDWLPAPFDGFGFNGNVTYQESDAEVELAILDEDDALVILGQAQAGDTFVRSVPFFNSPNITANWQIFYDKGPIETAISWAYQSESLDVLEEFGLDQYDASFSQLDFSFEYDILLGGSSPIRDLDFYFRVSDITDGGRKFSSFQHFGDRRVISDFASFNGREFRFGIQGRF